MEHFNLNQSLGSVLTLADAIHEKCRRLIQVNRQFRKKNYRMRCAQATTTTTTPLQRHGHFTWAKRTRPNGNAYHRLAATPSARYRAKKKHGAHIVRCRISLTSTLCSTERLKSVPFSFAEQCAKVQTESRHCALAGAALCQIIVYADHLK